MRSRRQNRKKDGKALSIPARYIALGVPMIAVGVKNLIAQSGLDFIGKAKAAAAGRAKS